MANETDPPFARENSEDSSTPEAQIAPDPVMSMPMVSMPVEIRRDRRVVRRRQAAEVLGVSESTFRRLMAAGEVKPCFTEEGVKFFDVAALVPRRAKILLPSQLPANGPDAEAETEARIFEAFEAGKSPAEVVIALRVRVHRVKDLYDTWKQLQESYSGKSTEERSPRKRAQAERPERDDQPETPVRPSTGVGSTAWLDDQLAKVDPETGDEEFICEAIRDAVLKRTIAPTDVDPAVLRSLGLDVAELENLAAKRAYRGTR